MEIKRVGTQPSGKGRQIGSPARYELIRYFRHLIRRS